METVTRENCQRLNNFEHISAKNADGSRLRCRRNGRTKIWKKEPEKFEIPVKQGLHEYGQINNNTAKMWEGE